MKKIHITTLGCFKNQVDSDVLAGQLKNNQCQLVSDPEEAEVVIINTCGFVEDAKKESIDAIFEAVELKKNAPSKKILVSGCLSQRYKTELKKEIPEIDHIFGTEDYESILAKLSKNSYGAENLYKLRRISTPSHYSYLKISEGCNHQCAFCAIPSIRGKHRSRTLQDIISEAEMLSNNGVKELILVSQDTSYYGRDLKNQERITDLIQILAKKELFDWIRPLYWYPTNFPIKYIEMMADFPSVIPYLDMPIQHASTNVLKKMNRAETLESLKKIYYNIKSIQPDIALRTTVILGHPGETEKDFEILKNFVEEIKFDRLGTFIYSDEEGTFAYDLENKVEQIVALERRNNIMEIQQRISKEKNEDLIDSVQQVMIDAFDEKNNYYSGRTYRDTPEIDNEVIIYDKNKNKNLVGTIVPIIINDASEYELFGKIKN